MQRSMRLLVVLLLQVLCASPVFAQRPTIEYFDVGGAFTLSGVCSFDVFAEPTGNNEKLATFFNQEGDITFQVLTGVNKWRFTNVDTGMSIDLNASGPGRFFVEPGSDIVRAETGGTSFLFVANGAGGLPAFAFTRGRLVVELDVTTFTVQSVILQQGTVQDICALLS